MFNIDFNDIVHLKTRCKKLKTNFSYYLTQYPVGYVVIINEFGFTEIGKVLDYLDKLEESIESLKKEL